jgi:hypothetical protein
MTRSTFPIARWPAQTAINAEESAFVTSSERFGLRKHHDMRSSARDDRRSCGVGLQPARGTKRSATDRVRPGAGPTAGRCPRCRDREGQRGEDSRRIAPAANWRQRFRGRAEPGDDAGSDRGRRPDLHRRGRRQTIDARVVSHNPQRDLAILDGPDIYHTTTVSREVYTIKGGAKCVSGGPLIDRDGKVLGVSFGEAVDDSDTSFALTADEASRSWTKPPTPCRWRSVATSADCAVVSRAGFRRQVCGVNSTPSASSS